MICAADKKNQAILGTDIEKCSLSEFQQHYEACINALKAKRGKPRDHQLRELLGTYYTMCQQANESVADFGHRFRETQHELENLLPAIHQTPDKDGNTEVELIFASEIRYEVYGFSRVTHDQDLSPSWRPDALYSGHNMGATPRPNMNSNNMKYANTASPNRNNTNWTW